MLAGPATNPASHHSHPTAHSPLACPCRPFVPVFRHLRRRRRRRRLHPPSAPPRVRRSLSILRASRPSRGISGPANQDCRPPAVKIWRITAWSQSLGILVHRPDHVEHRVLNPQPFLRGPDLAEIGKLLLTEACRQQQIAFRRRRNHAFAGLVVERFKRLVHHVHVRRVRVDVIVDGKLDLLRAHLLGPLRAPRLEPLRSLRPRRAAEPAARRACATPCSTSLLDDLRLLLDDRLVLLGRYPRLVVCFHFLLCAR